MRNALFAAVAAVLLVLVGILHVASSLWWEDSFWGAHFYAFFPPSVLVAATVLLTASGFLFAVPERMFVVRAPLPRTLPGRLSAATLLFLAAAGLFWILRLRHGFLGDGFSFMRVLPQGNYFAARQPLASILQDLLYRTAGPFLGTDLGPDETAFRAVALGSVISGGLFVLVATKLGGEILRSRPKATLGIQTLIVFLILSQGYLQLFLGYVENYTFLALGFSLYLLAGLLYLRDRLPLIVPALALLLCTALHLSAAALVPSFLFLMGWGFRDRTRWIGTLRDLILGAAALAGAVALLRLASPGYDPALTLLGMIKKGFGVSGALTEGQPLFSRDHFRDFFNGQILIGPLGVLLFVPGAVLAFFSRNLRDPRNLFLLVLGGTLLATAWLLRDLELGYARDWDILAPSGVVFTVAGLYLWLSPERDWSRWRQGLAVLLAVSIYHTAPWIAVNASLERGIARFETLPLGMGRMESSLSTYYLNWDRLEEAREWAEKSLAANPYNHMARRNLGLVALEREDFSAAAEHFEIASALIPGNLQYRHWLVGALIRNGQEAESVSHLEHILARAPRDLSTVLRLCQVLCNLNRYEASDSLALRAVALARLDPGSRDLAATVFCRMGEHLGDQGEWARARESFERAVALATRPFDAHLQAGVSYANRKRFGEAREFWKRALEFPADPEKTERVRAALEALP